MDILPIHSFQGFISFRRLQRISLQFLTCLPLLVSAKTTLAETIEISHYQVEVLIVENINTEITESFTTPQQTNINNSFQQLVESTQGNAKQTQLLPRSDYKLTTVARRLQRNPDFKLLQHLSWDAPLQEGQQEVFIIPTRRDSESMTELSGAISVRLGRYLHVKPDLLLTQWASPRSSDMDSLADQESMEASDVFEGESEGDDSANATVSEQNGEDNEEDKAQDNEEDYKDNSIEQHPLWRELKSELKSEPENELKGELPTPGTEQAADQPPTESLPSAAAPTSQYSDQHPFKLLGLEPVYYYHLKTSRRLRSQQLNYIDHPKLSLLVEIYPIELVVEPPLAGPEAPSVSEPTAEDTNSGENTNDNAGGNPAANAGARAD